MQIIEENARELLQGEDERESVRAKLEYYQELIRQEEKRRREEEALKN